MHSLAAIGIGSLLLVASAIVCIARTVRRRGGPGVHCSLELTPQDGWRLLNLAVLNRQDAKIWVERAAFVITELNADMQGGPAGKSGAVEIREFVRAGEDLHVSLIEPVYNAAGKPQGVYSFVFNCKVRYRLGDGWNVCESPAFRVEMVRLSAVRVRRIAGETATPGALAATSAASVLSGNAPSQTNELSSSADESKDLDAAVRS